MGNISEQKDAVSPVNAEIDHHTRLTATELGNLWTTYMNYTGISNVVRHFNVHVEDSDVRAHLAEALEIANKRVSGVMEIFSREQYPIPAGFSEEDVAAEAPRLYSDIFYLFYLITTHAR